MNRLFTAISLTLLHSVLSLAQAPDTLWTKAMGDTSNDGGSSIVQRVDGGFIVCGSKGTEVVTDAYTTDIWIINTDENGNVINSNTYGGMESVKVIPTSDNGYMLLANTFTPQGNNFEDIILLKLNENGDTLWTKTINLMWSDYGREIHETLDGGFIILFRSTGNPNGIRLYRTNSIGDTIWTKIYNTSNGSAQITSDNGFIFLSYKDSTWISKEDSSGNIEWIKSFTSEFRGTKIIRTNDPGYYIVGHTYPDPIGPPQDIGVMKINTNGDSLWFQSYPIQNWRSVLSKSTITSDGDLIISGSISNENIFLKSGLLLKIDSNGNLKWSKIIDVTGLEILNETHQLDDGTYISVGSKKDGFEYDLWLVKLSQDPTSIREVLATPSEFSLSQNYPNPFNPSTNISWQVPVGSQQTLKIYDVLGNEIATLVDEYKPAGSYEIEWKASGLPSGIYFYTLKTQKFTQTKKMILMK